MQQNTLPRVPHVDKATFFPIVFWSFVLYMGGYLLVNVSVFYTLFSSMKLISKRVLFVNSTAHLTQRLEGAFPYGFPYKVYGLRTALTLISGPTTNYLLLQICRFLKRRNLLYYFPHKEAPALAHTTSDAVIMYSKTPLNNIWSSFNPQKANYCRACYYRPARNSLKLQSSLIYTPPPLKITKAVGCLRLTGGPNRRYSITRSLRASNEVTNTRELRPRLGTLAERRWLQTPAGTLWLTTPSGYAWLESERGREWYTAEDGNRWLHTPRGVVWSEAKAARLFLWLTTPAGLYWLTTKDAYKWLRTRQGRQWACTERGSEWLQTNISKISLPTTVRLMTRIRGALHRSFESLDIEYKTSDILLPAKIIRNYYISRLYTAAGHPWLASEDGRNWLATEEASFWLSTTPEGRVWLTTDDGIDWACETPVGCRWLCSAFGSQFNANSEEESHANWLATDEGDAWLAAQNSVGWLNPGRASKWLLREQGQRWLTTDLGSFWLTTPAGATWLFTELGSTWLETTLGRKWLDTDDAFTWLRTSSGGRRWLCSEAGLNWLRSPCGQKYHETALSRLYQWFDREEADGLLDGLDAPYVGGAVGTRWMLQTDTGYLWLTRTESGAKWLNTKYGSQWWLTHVRNTSYLCPGWGKDLWLCTQEGTRWLASERGKYWLCTNSGARWLCTSHGVRWLCTEGGAKWLLLNKQKQLPTPVFFKAHHQLYSRLLRWARINWPSWFQPKLSFAQGHIWLTNEAGLSRILLPDGVTAVLSTELGFKWLHTRNARMWLDTSTGVEWLATPPGVKWYSKNKGGLATPGEKALSWIMGSVRKGFHLLYAARSNLILYKVSLSSTRGRPPAF